MSATQTFFGDSFVDKDGKSFTPVHLEHNKLIGLFFSADWCPPCRNFTPVLAEFYHSVKRDAPHDIEIIYLSFDQSLEQYRNYLQSMPWKTIPLGDPRIKQFSTHFNVNSIPTLVITRPDGTLVTKDGRTDVTVQGTKAIEAWKSSNK